MVPLLNSGRWGNQSTCRFAGGAWRCALGADRSPARAQHEREICHSGKDSSARVRDLSLAGRQVCTSTRFVSVVSPAARRAVHPLHRPPPASRRAARSPLCRSPSPTRRPHPPALPTCFTPPRAQVVAGHTSPRVLSCAPKAVMGTSSPVTAAQAKRGWWKPVAAPRRTSPRSHDPNGRAVAPSASVPSPVGVIGVAAVTGQPSKADLRSLGGRTRLPRPRNARVASRRFVPAVGTGAFFVRAGHAMRAGLADSPGASGAR